MIRPEKKAISNGNGTLFCRQILKAHPGMRFFFMVCKSRVIRQRGWWLLTAAKVFCLPGGVHQKDRLAAGTPRNFPEILACLYSTAVQDDFLVTVAE
jgi:hypothetical protein